MAIPEFTTRELESEEWLPIVGYEGIYSVSNLGRVRREMHVRSHLPRVFGPSFYSRGYAIYSLSHLGKIKRFTGARLVLTAFVGPAPPDHQANHIDGQKPNNRMTNLEWVSRSGNQQHAIHVLHHVGGGNRLLTEAEATNMRALFDEKLWAQRRAIYRELMELFQVEIGLVERIIERKSYVLPRAN